MAKIATEPVRGERLVFLRPSEEALDAIAGAKRNEIAVKQEKSDWREIRMEHIAKNKSKGAEIAAE